jgi:tripartite-type tricarboxylate transporter receptor subunit TctC
MNEGRERALPRISPRLALSIFPLFGCTFGAAAADSENDFYKGKQIQIFVGTTPGDAYDLFARIIARVMGKYIPGNPTFIVQYMPGAGGMTVSNYMYNTAARDGTVIAAPTQSIPTASLLAPTGVRYDPTEFSWIGSITKDVFVSYVWNTSSIKSLNDLWTKEGIFGANGVGSAGIDFPLVVRDVLGMKLKVIPGYADQTSVRLAMERGEIDGTFGNGWTSLNATQPTWVSEGKVRIITQFGFEKDPEIPGDVPVLLDLVKNEADRQAIELVTARQEFSKPYVAPPGVPPERLNILRKAFDAAIKDPEFAAEAKQENLEINEPMNGADLAALTLKLSQTPPAVVARIQNIFKNFQAGK